MYVSIAFVYALVVAFFIVEIVDARSHANRRVLHFLF